MATTLGTAFTSSLVKMSSHFSYLPKIVRNVLFLTSLVVSPLKQFGCCFWGWRFFRVPAGAQLCV